MRAKPFVLMPVLTALLLLQPVQALEEDQISRLRPPLGKALERYEKGMDIRSAVGSPLAEHMTDGLIPCFVRLQDPSVDPEALGFEAHTMAGSVCTAKLLPEQILDLATRPEVQHISMATLTRPLLDVSIVEIKADQVHQSDDGDPPVYSGHTGDGIVVGIIDSGIDHQHPDFWSGGSTRIISVWDQNSAGTPPAGFGYGNECDQAEIEAASCTETDTNGHGTHVSGIGGGNGQATGNGEPAYQFVGVAPEADIICVATTFLTTDVVDGVYYIFSRAAGLGEPAVVNLSLGTHFGPHDGWADFDISLTNIVGKGKIVVAAAGNEMGDAIHAEALVAQSATETVTFEIPEYSVQPGDRNDIVDMDGWYTGGSQLSLPSGQA
jgi:subtilisin family serine protease